MMSTTSTVKRQTSVIKSRMSHTKKSKKTGAPVAHDPEMAVEHVIQRGSVVADELCNQSAFCWVAMDPKRVNNMITNEANKIQELSEEVAQFYPIKLRADARAYYIIFPEAEVGRMIACYKHLADSDWAGDYAFGYYCDEKYHKF